MILFRSRLIFGLIWKVIKVFFTVVYSVLAFFNLHFTLLLGLIGVVLYFTGALSNNRAVLIVFALLLVLSVVYAVMATIKKLLGFDGKVKRSKGMQIVDKSNSNDNTVINEKPVLEPQPQSAYGGYQAVQPKQSEVPRYFRVKQNPSFIMAVYTDRYELFKTENGKLIKIRTDYKA